jgi:hypothetical protein
MLYKLAWWSTKLLGRAPVKRNNFYYSSQYLGQRQHVKAADCIAQTGMEEIGDLINKLPRWPQNPRSRLIKNNLLGFEISFSAQRHSKV